MAFLLEQAMRNAALASMGDGDGKKSEMFDTLIEKVLKVVVELYNKNSDNGKTEDVAMWAAKQTEKLVDRVASDTADKIKSQIRDRRETGMGAIGVLAALMMALNDDEGNSSKSGASVSDASTKEIKYPLKKGELVGHGTFGAIFRASGADGFAFAIREVKAQGQEAERLKGEIKALTKLSQDSVVKCFGFAEGGGKTFMYLELLTGSVADMMKKTGKACSTTEARKFSTDVVRGLTYLHGENILHKNIKCANILLDASGKAKLGDMGLSKSESQQSKDSIFWRSPENIENNIVGKRTDIWSVGCAVYEMMTKAPPYADIGELGLIMIITSAKGGLIIHDDMIKQENGLPSNLKSFLLQIFVPLDKRPYIADISTHRWLIKDGCLLM